MVEQNLIAEAEVLIAASVDIVWDALVNPETVKKYMFGTTVVSDWKVGSEIIWRGEWQGKPYEDKGIILQLIPQKILQYTHYSPVSGLPDDPENHHTITTELADKGGYTFVSLSQDNNRTAEAREHSEKNWTMMLRAMKKFIGERVIVK